MKKIRLLVEGHLFDGVFQGSRTFLEGLYNEMIRNSSNVFDIYIAGHYVDNLKKSFPTLPDSNFIPYRTQSRYIRLGIEVPSIIRKYKIDFAHFTYFTPFIKNCKFIVTMHDVIFNNFPEEFSWQYRFSRNFFFKYALRKADIITTLSEFSRESIANYLDIESSKIKIVSVGIENKFFEPYVKNECQKILFDKYGIGNYILYVSRIEPRKNHLFLLNAFLDLKLYNKGIYLIFIGKESIPVKDLYSKLDSLNPEIKKFVRLYDSIDNDEILEFYRGAEIFVYPSKGEGFGIPPIESGALRIKTLCSNTSSMSDFGFFGDNSFNPNDFYTFKEKLNNTINNSADNNLQTISEHIKNTYTWKKSAKALEKLILDEA